MAILAQTLIKELLAGRNQLNVLRQGVIDRPVVEHRDDENINPIRNPASIMTTLEAVLVEHEIEYSSESLPLEVWTAVESMSVDEMLALTAWLPTAKNQTQNQNTIASLIYRTLANNAPEVLLANPRADGKWEGSAKVALLRVAMRDFDKALKWVEDFSLESGNPYFNTDYLTASLAPVAACVAPHKAIELLDSVQDFKEFEHTVRKACLSAGSPDTRELLLNHVVGIGDERLVPMALTALGRSVLWTEGFEPAARYLRERIAPEDLGSELVGLYEYDRGEQPRFVGEWLRGNIDPDYRAQAVKEHTDQWMRYDILSAGEWLAEMEQAPESREAAKHFVDTIAKVDAHAARAWAERLKVP